MQRPVGVPSIAALARFLSSPDLRPRVTPHGSLRQSLDDAIVWLFTAVLVTVGVASVWRVVLQWWLSPWLSTRGLLPGVVVGVAAPVVLLVWLRRRHAARPVAVGLGWPAIASGRRHPFMWTSITAATCAVGVFTLGLVMIYQVVTSSPEVTLSLENSGELLPPYAFGALAATAILLLVVFTAEELWCGGVLGYLMERAGAPAVVAYALAVGARFVAYSFCQVAPGLALGLAVANGLFGMWVYRRTRTVVPLIVGRVGLFTLVIGYALSMTTEVAYLAG